MTNAERRGTLFEGNKGQMKASLAVVVGCMAMSASVAAAESGVAVRAFHSGKCLANIGKAGVADCSGDSRLELLPVEGSTVMLRARGNHCLFANKDGRFAWFGCTKSYSDQHWTVVQPSEGSANEVKGQSGLAMLRSVHSGKCLFSNKDGRFGLFECTPGYGDQYWTVAVAAPEPVKVAGDTPMSGPDFDALVAAINAASFSADKQNALKLGVKGRSLTVAQVAKLIDLMPYSEDKLSCLRVVHKRISDRKNEVQLLDHFDYSEDKETATSILED